jgi:uncharacterized phage protein gp47/JayE
VVLAGLVNGLYGYQDWIAQQSNPFTATEEFLEAWAALKDIIREAALAAGGEGVFPANPGATVPAGTILVRGDGFQYQTTADAEASGNSVTVAFMASDAGSSGNAAEGVQLTLGAAIPNVGSGGAASTPITGGTDTETDDSLRNRMLQAFAAPAQGGAQADYVNWALDVPGVTRAWAIGSGAGPGTVQVFFMMDGTEGAYGGFPQGSNGVAANETRAEAATGDQLIVANAIYPQRPVTALVYALAPGANTVAFTISGLSGASAATKSAIAAAIASVFLAQAAVGGTTDSSGNPLPPVQLSAIESAVGAVAGSAGYVITAESASAGAIVPGPTGNITSNVGYLATPGAITYV